MLNKWAFEAMVTDRATNFAYQEKRSFRSVEFSYPSDESIVVRVNCHGECDPLRYSSPMITNLSEYIFGDDIVPPYVIASGVVTPDYGIDVNGNTGASYTYILI